MNKTTEALKLAEEALETAPIEYDFHGEPVDKEFAVLSNKALAAIREALAEQDKQEPVKACVSGVCPNKAKCDAAQFCLYTEAEPVKQEPVAWGVRSTDDFLIFQNESQAQHYADEWEFEVTPLYAAPVSVEAAVLAEREACAKVCEEIIASVITKPMPLKDIVAAIRARGEK